MSRFLLAWEIGAGYGHLARLLPLTDELARRGHEPVLALRNLARAQTVFAGRDLRILQAPTWIGVAPPGPYPATYPGTLIQRGYDRSEHILGMLRGWLGLLELVRPDFLVAEHAPTALLAARLKHVPAGAIGTSFVCPSRATPMPMMFGQKAAPALQLRIEQIVHDNVNAALERLRAAPLRVLADICPPVGDIVATFPELDHYGPDPAQTYWGPFDRCFGTARPPWPSAEGPKVLVYVQSWFSGLSKLIADLQRLGVPALLHIPGSGPEPGPALRLSRQPVDLDYLVAEAELVVCHASHGTTVRALLNGVPQVTLPMQFEQEAIGARVAALGAGVSAPPGRAPDFDYAALIERALQDPRLAAAASAFATAYAGFEPTATPGRIVDFYEDVLPAAGRSTHQLPLRRLPEPSSLRPQPHPSPVPSPPSPSPGGGGGGESGGGGGGGGGEGGGGGGGGGGEPGGGGGP
jgi:UDP:flavonoid glycosyltransferase YjiC (YdhE family)